MMRKIIVLFLCLAMLFSVLPANADNFWKMYWKPGEYYVEITPEEDTQIKGIIDEAL